MDKFARIWAVLGLLELPEDNPVARFELARAACALGEQLAADTALAQFVELAGHQEIGGLPSIELHAQILAWRDQRHEALELVREVRRRQPGRALHLFAALAIETNHLDDAQKVLERLEKKNARDPRLPQLVAAYSLRKTVRELMVEYPALRGEPLDDPAEARRQMEAASARNSEALHEAVSGLPDVEVMHG